ncbi:MAG: hypothetical protein U9N35_04145 [Euryarchaeota archaeon]|nr:hypothetical protein [Euryarchaeota archaeon]
MNKNFLVLLSLCAIAVTALAYYGIYMDKSDVNKEKGVRYYITKGSASCASEESRELYTENYIIQKNGGIREIFSKTSGNESETSQLICQSSDKVIRYAFDDKGELSGKTVITGEDYDGYFWWGSYAVWSLDSVEVGQKWGGNITTKAYYTENQQFLLIDTMDLYCETEVLAYEEVKVEAGSFDCYKVKLVQSGEYEKEKTKKAVKYTITLWYSPDLKIIVKDIFISQFGDYECTNRSELIEYE